MLIVVSAYIRIAQIETPKAVFPSFSLHIYDVWKNWKDDLIVSTILIIHIQHAFRNFKLEDCIWRAKTNIKKQKESMVGTALCDNG
jgi:hypothetical protein